VVLEGNSRQEEGRGEAGASDHGTRRINKKRLTQSGGANHFYWKIEPTLKQY